MSPVNPLRIHPLNSLPVAQAPIVYWMSRDQRLADNWALLHAQQLALESRQPLAVVFTLADRFLGATLRQYGFMLRGLALVADRLRGLNIPFFLLPGDPPAEICRFVQRHGIGAVVTDFDPLRIKRLWRETAALTAAAAFHEVDGHNIVPCRLVSDHREYGAYTLRPKLRRQSAEFLVDFPGLVRHPWAWPGDMPGGVDVAAVLDGLPIDRQVVEVAVESGEAAAHRCLEQFIRNRLEHYAERSNDPLADVQSGLSPYLHFGQIAPQRVALEAARAAGDRPGGEAFLEQLIVRRELSDNFCWYTPDYDRTAGFPAWASRTLAQHRHDRRAFLYPVTQFERGETHDPLWNAAQREMVSSGRMHGYMRMYWAKKILEWSGSPEEALETAIRLNDRYQLDGRDPNGYTGIAWSIGGVHDRAWGERPVFGTIRYMNDKGCRRKFDVERYIERWTKG